MVQLLPTVRELVLNPPRRHEVASHVYIVGPYADSQLVIYHPLCFAYPPGGRIDVDGYSTTAQRRLP